MGFHLLCVCVSYITATIKCLENFPDFFLVKTHRFPSALLSRKQMCTDEAYLRDDTRM
jgi:hypothetical protein